MAIEHIVKQGDYLSKIAHGYGLSDWRAIWDDPRNAGLRAKRKDPNVLFPRDVLIIPDRAEKEASGDTDRRHTFRRLAKQLRLQLKLDRPYYAPLTSAQCELMVEGESSTHVTDADGRLGTVVRPAADTARLLVREADRPLEQLLILLRVGHLDPVEETSGQIARLNNLGYFADDPAADAAANARAYRSAVEEFQCDEKLAVDGVCGAKTQTRLQAVHGC